MGAPEGQNFDRRRKISNYKKFVEEILDFVLDQKIYRKNRKNGFFGTSSHITFDLRRNLKFHLVTFLSYQFCILFQKIERIGLWMKKLLSFLCTRFINIVLYTLLQSNNPKFSGFYEDFISQYGYQSAASLPELHFIPK